MAEIIRLRGSPHERAQQLLPWYVNGTLEAHEASMVESHLAECAECRADMAAEQVLAREVAALPLDVEHAWSMLSDRIDAAGPPRRLAQPVPFLRRKVAIGWALGGPLAAAAAVAFAVAIVPGAPSPVGETYRALGSAPTVAPGNALVMFRPDARDSDLRAALTKARARVVDGPTASGAYVVRIAPASRAQALDGLRATPQIVLAEPIDAGSQP
ncbi:zf-HC2 domain-containing protein [Sphingomonas asaccharolytica]|uniref:zf-HC2 domain-containing protein n=1 Tax=Sphingomonas asaccharolytica TaxID=40681 RepID=UPI0008329C9C|nr:zf-HC2 domain-containing protein [Sphingomonas asaccharolytica]